MKSNGLSRSYCVLAQPLRQGGGGAMLGLGGSCARGFGRAGQNARCIQSQSSRFDGDLGRGEGLKAKATNPSVGAASASLAETQDNLMSMQEHLEKLYILEEKSEMDGKGSSSSRARALEDVDALLEDGSCPRWDDMHDRLANASSSSLLREGWPSAASPWRSCSTSCSSAAWPMRGGR